MNGRTYNSIQIFFQVRVTITVRIPTIVLNVGIKTIGNFPRIWHTVFICIKIGRPFRTRGRRLCVLNSQGNRRDDHYANVGRAAAGAFDHYICTRGDELRGREPDEVPNLLRDGLIAAGVAADRITAISSEEAAVAALRARRRSGRCDATRPIRRAPRYLPPRYGPGCKATPSRRSVA